MNYQKQIKSLEANSQMHFLYNGVKGNFRLYLALGSHPKCNVCLPVCQHYDYNVNVKNSRLFCINSCLSLILFYLKVNYYSSS